MSAQIPLADAGALRPAWRRTTAIRWVLASGLAVLVLVTALLLSRPAAPPVSFLPQASNAIVVLDLSASISSDTFNRIGETLEELAATNGRYGLVVFSDVAYQALPPGTPSSELRAYARYFKVPEQTTPGLAPSFPVNPWTDSFSAGTRISSGLGRAFEVVRSQHLADPGVILISDLDDDPGDEGALRSIALAYRHEAITLRIVALNPSPDDRQRFSQLLGAAADITQAHLPGERPEAADSRFPVGLALLALAIALLLAGNELVNARLTWRTPG